PLPGEHALHTGEVVEVRLDVLPLRRIELLRLLCLVVGLFHQSSSSSTKEKALNASAYSTPILFPISLARSRTHGVASSSCWERCCASAFNLMSIVSVMSTKRSGSSAESHRFGISNGSNPSSRSSSNWGRVGASGITAQSASSPAALWSARLM